MMSHDVIFIAAEPWEHYTWRRRHHIAWNLAKNNNVLFVEPPLTIFQPFRDIDLNFRHLLNLGRLKYQGRNLYSYSPVRLFPLSLPGAERFNYYEKDKKRTFDTLKRIFRKLKFKNPILWVYFHPFQYDYYGLFDEKIRVTDWYDKFTAYSGYKLAIEQTDLIKNKEENILKKSDVIFAVSQPLGNEIRATGKSVYVIPHGVDYESFEKCQNGKRKVKGDFENIKRPILGFIGIMHYIVDFELLLYIAERRLDWNIVLLGKTQLVNKAGRILFNKLVNKENVYYLGEKSREDLPSYFHKMDVCLMPMKRIEINKVTTGPLKLWEYLAAGKPVVAVDHGIRYDCHEYIKVADSKEAFVKSIAEALEEEKQNGELLAKARKEMARQNSWRSRVNQMMEIIESHLEG